jgi:predicted anti-sigma-YlaC factor YlaD
MPRRCVACFDEALLSGFLDGVITARDRRLVTTHLAACAECRGLLSELREIRQACLSTRFRRSPSPVRSVSYH